MSTRLTARLSLAALALAFAASPAFAQTSNTMPAEPPASTAPAAPMRHHAMRHGRTHHMTGHMAGEGKLMPTKAGDEAIDNLNAQSLAAAQSGQTFTPSGTPSPPAAQAAPRGRSHDKM